MIDAALHRISNLRADPRPLAPGSWASNCRSSQVAPLAVTWASMERAQALQLGRVLGRHDEPEVMPVVPAVLGKNLLVDDVRSRVEHPRVGTIVGHPAALQIGDVPR